MSTLRQYNIIVIRNNELSDLWYMFTPFVEICWTSRKSFVGDVGLCHCASPVGDVEHSAFSATWGTTRCAQFRQWGLNSSRAEKNATSCSFGSFWKSDSNRTQNGVKSIATAVLSQKLHDCMCVANDTRLCVNGGGERGVMPLGCVCV